MASINKDIERLIVRRLDDALTADEALQLDRELIRNPGARALFEDYQRVDALATAALTEVLGDEARSFDVATLTPRAGTRPRPAMYRRGRWLVSGAVAAALLAVIIPSPSLDHGDNGHVATSTPPAASQSAPVGTIDPNGAAPRDLDSGLQRNVSQLPRSRGKTYRDVFGVMGDDGSIYWIEVDRSRTLRQVPADGALDPGREL